jgi:hypothetical protein
MDLQQNKIVADFQLYVLGLGKDIQKSFLDLIWVTKSTPLKTKALKGLISGLFNNEISFG